MFPVNNPYDRSALILRLGPDAQHPELIQSDEILNNKDYPPYPPEVVSKWRIGAQLRHAMEAESAQLGHAQGAIEFIRLLKSFALEDMQNVSERDIDIILEIMCTFDRSDLLRLLIEHPYLSDFLRPTESKIYQSSPFQIQIPQDDEKDQIGTNVQSPKLLKATLKKSIRAGKIKILNYLTTQNVIPINLFDDTRIDSKQYQSDLKSLIFNILKAVHIGAKRLKYDAQSAPNCFLCAQKFWTYLATMLYSQNTDDKTMKTLMSKSSEKEQKSDDVKIWSLKAMNENLSVIEYICSFMNKIFEKRIEYNWETYIHNMSEDKYLKPIFAVLRFQRERYITFECRKNIKNVWRELVISLIDNYKQHGSVNKQRRDCLEWQMFDYLVSGGVPFNVSDAKDICGNGALVNAVKRGNNNYRMMNWTYDEMKPIMPSIFPFEINKIIVNFICLDAKNLIVRKADKMGNNLINAVDKCLSLLN